MTQAQAAAVIALDVVAATVVVAASVTDLRRREVPNWLTYGGVACGLVASALVLERGQLAAAAFAMVFVLLVLGLPCWLGGIGAGDLKLMLAVGALVRTPVIYDALVYGLVAAACCGVVVALRGGRLAASLVAALRFLRASLPGARPLERAPDGQIGGFTYFPMAPALAVGTLAALVETRVEGWLR